MQNDLSSLAQRCSNFYDVFSAQVRCTTKLKCYSVYDRWCWFSESTGFPSIAKHTFDERKPYRGIFTYHLTVFAFTISRVTPELKALLATSTVEYLLTTNISYDVPFLRETVFFFSFRLQRFAPRRSAS